MRLRTLGRAAVAAVVVVLLGEAALRVERFGWSRDAFGPWTDPPPWDALRGFDAAGDPTPRAHADAAWALAPGQPVVRYRLDGLGLRDDRDVAAHAPPGTCRVLALGDAYTFGYGVAAGAAYPRRLAARLAHRGMRVEVLNAGFPNLDAEQQARRLARLVPRLAPDVVVVTFDWWNVPLPPPSSRPARWSRGWIVANAEEKAERVGRWVGVVHATLDVSRRALTPAVFAPSGLAREVEPLASTPAALGARWRRTEAALRAMAATATAAGARFVLVRVPLDLEVEPERAALYRAGALPYPAHGFPDADWRAATAMPAALQTFADGARIALVDTTPALRRHRGVRLFLTRDYHAAPAAHRLIAREVARWIVRNRVCG